MCILVIYLQELFKNLINWFYELNFTPQKCRQVSLLIGFITVKESCVQFYFKKKYSVVSVSLTEETGF